MEKWIERGKLPIGVEVEGVLHRTYEIRDTRVTDLIAVDSITNNQARQAALLSRVTVSLGDLPSKEITPNLIQGLTYVDYEALQVADGRLTQRMRTFRVAEGDAPQGDPDPGGADGVELR